jgi:hypothetical protein
MTGDLSLEDVSVIEMKGARGWHGLDRDALRVERLEGGSVQLFGEDGLAAIVARQRTPDGYFAYGTNAALYRPERILPSAIELKETG